jgi:hypothetical protein
MPTIATITPRPIYKEDCSLSVSQAPATVNTYVEGAGTVPLTPLTPILIDSLGSYASDAAAGVGGVAVGYLYFNSGTSLPKVRMS